jgi:hypothetical protein
MWQAFNDVASQGVIMWCSLCCCIPIIVCQVTFIICVSQPFGKLVVDVDHLVAATWHMSDPLASRVCVMVEPMLVRWTNERLSCSIPY